METWRTTFGYVEQETPCYEAVVERYRARILEASANQDLSVALGRAIKAARAELLARPIDINVMLPEQLLPP